MRSPDRACEIYTLFPLSADDLLWELILDHLIPPFMFYEIIIGIVLWNQIHDT